MKHDDLTTARRGLTRDRAVSHREGDAGRLVIGFGGEVDCSGLLGLLTVVVTTSLYCALDIHQSPTPHQNRPLQSDDRNIWNRGRLA